jgi:hypothetical protein
MKLSVFNVVVSYGSKLRTMMPVLNIEETLFNS